MGALTIKMSQAISAAEFRETLRLFPAGVTLVTTRDARGRRHGMTVSAFSSISADPPLVGVFIDRGCRLGELLDEEIDAFAVSFLGEDQEALSNRFAFEKEGDRFAEGAWEDAASGCPILADALAWLDCSIEERHELGSHDLLVGKVLGVGRPRADARPLVYWDRAYRKVR